VIDVSQSVEHDHPRGLEFLRMDIKNITDFFHKKGVITLQERTAFEFITAEDTTVEREEIDAVLEKLLQDDEQKPPDAEVDERVFRQAYIPQNLFEVVDPERDVGIVTDGGKNELIYAKLLDVQETKLQSTEDPTPPAKQIGQEGDGDEDEDDESDTELSDEETSDEDPAKPRGKRHEDKDAKKVTRLMTGLII
jgi:RIO kinase 1